MEGKAKITFQKFCLLRFRFKYRRDWKCPVLLLCCKQQKRIGKNVKIIIQFSAFKSYKSIKTK